MKYIILTFLSSLMLSACMNANTTGIQRGYVTMRDTCRTTAEGQFAYAQATGGAAAQKDASGTLAQLFSDCMESRGWAVASSKGRPGKTPPLDSIYDLPQTPGGRGPAASVASAKQVPQAAQPVQQQIPQQAQQGYAQQGYAVQPQYAQPQAQSYQQPALSSPQQQALEQQYYQQQQAYQNYMQQQQAYEQQYQQYYQQQPQAIPQQQYTQPQAQPQYYQQQPQQNYYQSPQGQPQSYYQQEQVEPLQHSATSLHLSRGGAGTSIGARAGGARVK